MRCIIHVGTHHTGTTSLQKVLSDQSDYLKDIGIIYPESIKEGYQHSLLPGAYLPNHYALKKNRSLDVNFYIKKLNEEIKREKYKLCFISSEVFTELLNEDIKSLFELLKILEKIFDDISIMYTSRDFKNRAFSAHKAQIRLSSNNPTFRTEIFNAPVRFRKKIDVIKIQLNKWKTFKKNLYILNMEDSDSPILMYINKIIGELNLGEDFNRIHSNYFRRILSSGNYILNEDPYKPISYLFIILVGMKIKAKEEYLKKCINIDLVNKFIDDCDSNLQRYLFIISKENVISFLENYKLAIFDENEIMEVFEKAEFPLSSRTIILELINKFIPMLILDPK